MNKTKRLLSLLQILRSYRHAVSGEHLAMRLGISIRTLYRDIALLQDMGAEIEGEAGVGYILKPTFFLPPLMFSPTEIQSLILGMQWVSQYADAPLSEAASHALNKIVDVLPASIKDSLPTFTLRVGPPASASMMKENLSSLRDAIASQKKIEIIYQSNKQKRRHLIVWPFTIGYFTDGRIMVAWCETTDDYRHFKTNQIISMKILNEKYPRHRDSLFHEWQALQLRKTTRKKENRK